ncbi:MAG: hypothetical protein GYA18_02505 [Chloroflexi bacterium]|nr:hypothetical protein [Chloroflexota bacterium]
MFKKIPFHVLLIPAYFVVALFSQNIAEVFPQDILRPLLAVFFLTLCLFLVFYWCIHKVHHAALINSTLFFFFFSYGLVYGALKTITVFGFSLARHRILLPVFLMLMILVSFKLSKLNNENTERFTQMFNLFGTVLLILPLANVVNILWMQRSISQVNRETSIEKIIQPANSQEPDIYYIIADAYGRADYLMDEYGFDNSMFIQWLEDKGFYVADCALSNYAHTVLSLSAAMQMDYIPEYASTNQYYDGGLDDYIVHNTLRTELERNGYKVVTFENVHWDYSDADIFYSFQFNIFSPYLRPFENVLLMNSMFRAVMEFNSTTQAAFSSLTSTPVLEHYLRQKFIMDTLENDVIQLPGPKFVFAHVETPHGPYVFDEDGTFQQEDAYYRGEYYSAINDSYGDMGYIKQIEFMNSRLESMIEKILRESKTPPIIVIQGDHSIEEFGTIEDRMKILYAIYLPDGNYSAFYSSITPVNTFRNVLNECFGTDYTLLEDHSYFSVRTARYTWQEVYENNPQCLINN